MGMGVFYTAVSGMNAAQLGIATTSHNIANQATPGYTRQSIVQSAIYPFGTGSGYIGQGANVDTVRRSYDKFLTQELLAAQTKLASLDSYQQEISKIDNLLGSSSVDLSGAMSDFFKSVNAVAANAADVPSRQAFISQGDSLVARFKLVDGQINQINQDANGQIAGEVDLINNLAQQIADMSKQINLATAQYDQPPNDLLDQRDQLVSDLNKHIAAVGLTQSDGSYTVFIGQGQPLVQASVANKLFAAPSTADLESMSVYIGSTNGLPIADRQLTGGKLGGLLAFRNEALIPARNALGRLAIGLASTFNNQQRLGTDANGAAGANFFKLPDPTVVSNLRNANIDTKIKATIVNSDYRVDVVGGNYKVTRLADGSPVGPAAGFTALDMGAADGVTVDGVHIKLTAGAAANGDSFTVQPGNAAGSRVIPDSDNTGTAKLNSSESNVQALEGSDYRLDYTAVNTFTLTRLSDNKLVATGTGGSVQAALDNLATKHQTGFSMALSGTPPSVGDSFQIEPTRSAAGNLDIAFRDTALVAAGMPFVTKAPITNTGTGRISTGQLIDPSLQATQTWPITLTYNTATKQFAVTGGTPAAAGPVDYDPAKAPVTITINGMSFTLTGAPANGDTFILAKSANAVTDNRNAQQLALLQSKNTMLGTEGVSLNRFDTGSTAKATFAQTFAAVVSFVGNKANAIYAADTAQTALATQAKDARDSVSGVNMDEEAAHLIEYQKAYQACAKCIGITNTLFDALLQAV